ncbi:MAG: alpha-amylase [Sphingomonadales bacterium]|nr:alpha-amylase [Sphingomonadales bacterium]NCQ21874.1 alpha-amylase [Sphingomonadales bacterium]NCT03270.1 alpha-amylase [Sphingomonadales bacterium]
MRLSAALLAAAVAATPAFAQPDYTPRDVIEVQNAAWTADAVLYQLNTRQFTPEGTFAAAQKQLPRLAEMGVDIIWLMPIHPIGEVNRKGSLGSPYAVRDYRAVNPEFGTEADFRAFVDQAHRLGLKVILDWVANHSAYDNPLTASHPEWYTRTPEGALMSPAGTDWSDVADFDYSQPGLRQYMTESLVYWVREFGVDGYRADVAGYVPTDFWNTARAELDAVAPVFMLAEWEQRDLHTRAFDATYGWGWKEAMQRLVKDGSGAGAMRGYYAGQSETWPHAAMRMVYTENHDQNSWDGVAAEIYGPAYEAAMALSFTGLGLPLVYNGQEADNDRMLKFFERDPIVWREGQHDALLRKLIALKTASPALHNGRFGAPMIEVPSDATADVYAFTRGVQGERVFAVFNLSPRPQQVTFQQARHHGRYTDALTGAEASFSAGETMALAPWGFRIFQETK